MRLAAPILRMVLVACGLMAMLSIALAAGPPATIAVTVSPGAVPADGNSFAELTATVRDSSGALVDDGTQVNWDATYGFVYPTTSTTTTGIAKGSLRAPTVVGTSTVTVTSGSATGNATVQIRAAAGTISFDTTTWNYYLMADGTSKAVCRLEVTDTYDDPVADGTIVTLSIDSGSVLSPVTTKDGHATTVITAPSAEATADLTATSGTATNTIVIGFGTSPFTPSAQIFPDSIQADGTSVCAIRGVGFGELDGTLLPDGTSVSFSTDAGMLLATTGLVYGGFAETVLQSSTTPGTATVTVSYGGQSESIPVAFTGNADAVSIQPSHISIPYGTANGMPLRIQVADANGNSLPDGTIVDLSTTSGTVDPKSVIEQGMGIANFFAPATAGSADITATFGAVSGTQTVYFVGPPDTIALTPDLSSISADGSSTCRFTIYVSDALGNPAADGTVVTLTTTSGSISGKVSTKAGFADAVLKSVSTPGAATVTASAGSASALSDVVFAGAPASVSVSADPETIPADGTARAFIITDVVDSGSRPVADGTVVTFTTTAGSITSTSATTNGKAVAKLTAPSTTGSITVTATCGSASDSTTVQAN